MLIVEESTVISLLVDCVLSKNGCGFTVVGIFRLIATRDPHPSGVIHNHSRLSPGGRFGRWQLGYNGFLRSDLITTGRPQQTKSPVLRRMATQGGRNSVQSSESSGVSLDRPNFFLGYQSSRCGHRATRR
jgi:hypothetical protein